jgi:hypothetical protein
MPSLKTQRQFVIDAHHVHGNTKYDYSSSVYVNDTTKIKIRCIVHGIFEQIPTNHLRGCGCPKCGSETAAKSRAKQHEKFISQAIKVHGSRYDYSVVDYKTCKTKIEIRCRLHGTFRQNPNNHLRGQGCPTCGHIQGQRLHLMKCRDRNQLYTLYIVRMTTKQENFLKVGITKDGIKERIRKLENVKIELIHSVTYSAPVIVAAEIDVLTRFQNEQYHPVISFIGHTECFPSHALLDLCEFIDDQFPQ